MKTITAEELKEKKKSDQNFTLLFVLSEDKFKEGHIPGSINIPLGDIGKRKHELDMDEMIVVYCESYDCKASPKAGEKLEKFGFKNIYDFEGGMKEWREKGYPIESSK